MLIGKISSKGRITLPKTVREALGVKGGDWIDFQVRGDTLAVRRIGPFDHTFHAALSETMCEWTTPEDDEAFRCL